MRTLRVQHRLRDDVFRSDQLDVIFLTLGFLLHGGIQVGVEAGEGGFTAEHGGRVP